jgi:hypothetical protein
MLSSERATHNGDRTMIGWNEDFEDLADECSEDIEELWLFEQQLAAEAADFRKAEALQATDSFPANEADTLPPW